MKKITILIVMAMLCLNFWANAQAIDVTTKGIQIGQQVPDVILNNLHNYKDKSGNFSTTAKLADFKGKLLILDFWATWCAPCIASIPKLEKLQKQFEGKLQILQVAYQKEKEVMPFLTDLKEQQQRILNTLPQVVADTALLKLFPHVYLPHYVWIDQNGIVKGITNGKPINEIEINKALNQEYQDLIRKKDFSIAFNKDAPLFFNSNGGDGSTMTYHAMLSTYVPGIGSGFNITPPTEQKEGFSKLLAKNVGIVHLFNFALERCEKPVKRQYTLNKVIYETKDSLVLNPLRMGTSWRSSAWTYELSLPPSLQSKGYELMHQDLIRFFPQYEVRLEKRKTLCYALRKLPEKTIKPSVGGEEIIDQNPTGVSMRNGSLNLFINMLDVYYFSNSKIPIVNLIEEEIFTDIVINAPLSNAEAINLELTKYGLELVKGEFEINMIVYRDAIK